MDDALRAGIAVYNAGEHHAAHDAWEHQWLELEAGTADERLLHGLIQFTAAVHHARNRNWPGATGLAGSAREYLAGLPDSDRYRGVDLDRVRAFLEGLAADPERIERAPPPVLTHEGTAVSLADLDAEATFVAARSLSEELNVDEAVLDRAISYARMELSEAGTGTMLALVFDLVRGVEGEGGTDRRALVRQRLEEHVERRRRRERDVEGLFDPSS